MTVISPPAVDVHAHFLPRSYREALERAGIKHPDGFPFVPRWSVDSALALMDEVGIGMRCSRSRRRGWPLSPANSAPAWPGR